MEELCWIATLVDVCMLDLQKDLVVQLLQCMNFTQRDIV